MQQLFSLSAVFKTPLLFYTLPKNTNNPRTQKHQYWVHEKNYQQFSYEYAYYTTALVRAAGIMCGGDSSLLFQVFETFPGGE
jgi:hypothetical protein